MSISAAQCRAARALLDWSQDQLSNNAQIARATIADFERNVRTPIRSNLIAITAALEAAGVEFVPENGGGAGVRFRKVELEYNRDVKVDFDQIVLRVRYRGHPYRVQIPRDVIEDLNRTNYRTPDELRKAVEIGLPIYLRAIEELLAVGKVSGDQITLTHDTFPDGSF